MIFRATIRGVVRDFVLYKRALWSINKHHLSDSLCSHNTYLATYRESSPVTQRRNNATPTSPLHHDVDAGAALLRRCVLAGQEPDSKLCVTYPGYHCRTPEYNSIYTFVLAKSVFIYIFSTHTFNYFYCSSRKL